MAKDKTGSKAAAAPKVSKVEAVKAGRVTKDDSKKSSKEIAKKTADKVGKKNKKKEPTPEPSSDEEEDDDDDDDTSEESDSSDDDEVAAPKTNGAAKTNGSAKAGAKEDSEDSEDDSSSEDEAPAAKTNGHANGKANGSAKAAAVDESDDSDDSSDDDEAADDDDDDDDDSSDDDEEEEEEKPAAAASKKRKADTEAEPAAKKAKITKIEINGELKDPTANLFVGGLSWNIDEDWLTREFEEFGELAGVRIITDRETGKSKGFGYVEFSDVANAVTALQTKNETEIDGRTIRMDFSNPRQPNGQTPQQRGADRASKFGDTTNAPAATLFVGNLSFEADEAAVTEHFSQYGTIMGVRLPTDRETGAPKGFGYVEMSSIEEAKAALEGLAGADIAGRPIRLDYSGPRPDNGGGRGGFGDRGGRGGGRGFGGGRGGGRGGFGDRGGRGGGRGRGGFGDRGGRGGGRGGSTNRGGFGDFSGKKVTF